jgi:hypothetical protein
MLAEPAAYALHIASSAFSCTMKMEAVFSSETSVKLYTIIRRQIQEDSTIHSYCCENIRLKMKKSIFDL